MTFVKVDPAGLQSALNTITSFAGKCEQAASSVRTSNATQGYPADLSSLTTAETSVGELRTTVSEIKTRLDAAVTAGSSGITFSGAPAGSFYIVPDGQDDTTENVRAATTSITDAIADAATIQAALDEGDYETISEAVKDKVSVHQDDDIYATILADTLGARGVALVAAQIMYPYNVEYPNMSSHSDYDAAIAGPVLRTWTSMFATAVDSNLWSDEHRNQFARSTASLVTDVSDDPSGPNSFMLPVGVDLLLTGGDWLLENNPAQVNLPEMKSPPVLNTRFLATLGNSIKDAETKDPKGVGWRVYSEHNPIINDDKWDPAPALLTAFGRQPDDTAILDFLAPSKPSAPGNPLELAESTWKWLSGRGVSSANLEPLTSVLAKASGLRKPSDDTTDERAAWLTEHAVMLLGKDINTSDWNATSRQNMTVILANSIGDIDSAANEGNHGKGRSAFDKSLPASWNARHDEELTNLLQFVLTDDTYLRTISEAAGRFSAERLTYATTYNRTSNTFESNYGMTLTNAALNARLYGYIYGACAEGRKIRASDKDDAATILLEAADKGLSFIKIGGPPWVGVGASILKGYLKDIAEDAMTGNEEKEGLTQADLQATIKEKLFDEAILAMDEARLIPEEAYLESCDQTEDEGEGQLRSPYSVDWMYQDTEGHWHLDRSKIGSDREGFNQWLTTSPTLQSVISSNDTVISNQFGCGLNKGSGEESDKFCRSSTSGNGKS